MSLKGIEWFSERGWLLVSKEQILQQNWWPSLRERPETTTKNGTQVFTQIYLWSLSETIHTKTYTKQPKPLKITKITSLENSSNIQCLKLRLQVSIRLFILLSGTDTATPESHCDEVVIFQKGERTQKLVTLKLCVYIFLPNLHELKTVICLKAWRFIFF